MYVFSDYIYAMKKIAALSFIFSLPLLISAQVTVKSPEDFTIGTHITFQQCDTTGVNGGFLGAKQTWDFSTLKSAKEVSVSIIAPDKAPNTSQFTKVTQVEKNSDGSYVYVDKEVLNSFMVGYVSGNMIIQYPKGMAFAKRPTNFGGTNSYPYTTKYTINGVEYNGTGMATLAADGYGTLILPNKKKYTDVVRIKIIHKQKDVAGNKTINTLITTYVWFDDKHKSALLKISTTNSPSYNNKSVEYLINEEDK